MAKNVNFKNSEPMEVQIKRAILNGMTFTDCEKCFSQKRSFIIDINNRISIEDRKALTGKGLADCVSQETQHQIAELLRKGKTTKAISQQTRLPAKVINAISEARIANVFEDLKQIKEKPVYQELTEITNNISMSAAENDIPEVDINASSEVVTSESPENKRGRKVIVTDEICELLFTEYESGKTMKMIANEYGISEGRVCYAITKWRKVNDIMNKRKLTYHSVNIGHKVPKEHNYVLNKETVEYIAKLLVAGFSNQEISAETNVDADTISRIRCKRSYKEYTEGYNFPKRKINAKTFNDNTMSKETFDMVISQIFERKSDKEISTSLALSVQTVNRIRNHMTFKKMTEGMEFPEPMDSLYRIDNDVSGGFSRLTPDEAKALESIETCEPDASTEEINENAEEESVEISEMSGSMTRLTPDQELEAEETHEEEEFEEEEEEYDCIGSKRYFMNITKAFAANAAAAVLIKDGTLITYAVDEVIENAIMRVIAMATVEEIKGSSLYLYGGEVSYEYLTNMIVCLGINEINLPKKDENN